MVAPIKTLTTDGMYNQLENTPDATPIYTAGNNPLLVNDASVGYGTRPSTDISSIVLNPNEGISNIDIGTTSTPATGTSIIADIPINEPIVTTAPVLETIPPATGTSIIAEPPITPIPVTTPVTESAKPPTASVTITNVPLVGDGITGILGSIGGMGGGSGATEETALNKEINASMPNLLLYLGIAMIVVVGYKVIIKK